MKKSSINPFNWHFADHKGVLIEAPTPMLFVSGQTAMSDAGETATPRRHAGPGQAHLVNLRTVLEVAVMNLGDVAQLNTHVTDIE